MNNLGFKQLSTENWLERDSTIQGFVAFAPDGSIHEISGEEWLREILQAQLNDTVPLEIRKLFEVARGVMSYGYYFYPIYALGIGQLFRVVESAVTFKCRMMGAPSKIGSFKQRINWLIEKGVIPKGQFLHWKGIKELRNLFSHPEMQPMYMPTEALKFIESTARDINSLFSGA